MRTAIIALMLLTTPAWAAVDENKPAFVTGIGTKTCEDYVSAQGMGKLPFVAYATGFISAFNLFNRDGKQYVKQPEEIFDMLDKVCGANRNLEFWSAISTWVRYMK